MRETELADVEKQVQARIKKQIEKNQKDYYLREQIKAIQTELGDKDGTDVETCASGWKRPRSTTRPAKRPRRSWSASAAWPPAPRKSV